MYDHDHDHDPDTTVDVVMSPTTPSAAGVISREAWLSSPQARLG